MLKWFMQLAKEWETDYVDNIIKHSQVFAEKVIEDWLWRELQANGFIYDKNDE